MPDSITPQINIDQAKVPSESSVSPEGEWQKYNPLYRSVADYLNIDVNNEWSRWKPRMDYLIEWASKKTRSNNPNKIVSAIDKFSNQLGPHSFGDKKIAHLYRHLKLGQKNLPHKTKVPQFQKQNKVTTHIAEEVLKNQALLQQRQLKSTMVHKMLQEHHKDSWFALKSALKAINNWRDRH